MAKWDHDDLKDKSQNYVQVLGTMPFPENKAIDYKYSEDRIIDEFRKYVDSTYGQHYTTTNNVQALDMWEALGSLFTSSRDTGIKYLCRAGKKGSAADTRKDVLKAMHYCLFMLHALDTAEQNVSNQ